MARLIAQNKSNQVAAKLRRDILAGHYPADAPLKSIRQLAETFKVGRQVIYSALQQLEAEKLIESRPRQGYLVCNRNNQDTKGIYFLAYGVDESNIYLQHLQKMTCPPLLPPAYNSWNRIITKHQANADMWQSELRRVSEMTGIDYFIIHATRLSRQEIEMTLSLPQPVIFVGDFADAIYTDLPLCQVVENSSAQISICQEYLVKKQCCDIAMITLSDDKIYIRDYIEAAQAEAARRDLKLTVLSLPHSLSKMSEEKRRESIRTTYNSIPDHADGIIIAGIDYNYVKEANPTISDLPLICTQSAPLAVAHLKPDFTNFYDQVYALCEKFTLKQPTVGRHIVELKYHLIE